MNPSAMATPTWLTDHFLIAMPSLDDPNFARSVTYLCQHNEDGALGIVINRPSDLTIGDVLRQMQLDADDADAAAKPVYIGGPVQTERGFVLHEPDGRWESSVPVSAAITVTTSRDVLVAMGRGDGPRRSLLALGYAGWGAGQLEQEMRDNAWLTVPADPAIVFDLPAERRWEAAARLVGIDPARLSSITGRA
jgi:putative transcriptional regulator